MQAAHAGDERALAGLTRVGTYLGVGIANLIAIISPDRVVIGGGVAAADALLLDPMRAESPGGSRRRSSGWSSIVPAALGTWAGADRGRRARGGGGVMDDPYRPRYRRIEQILRERIATLRPGDRSPPTRSCRPSSGSAG